jgi:hypothetical protein
MWLATTSRTLQVPRNYFSKRLAGFIIPKSSNPYYNFQIHSLYGCKGHIISCPLLPLHTKGGFVGALTIEVHFNRDGGHHTTGYALVVFGYPPSLTTPLVKVFGETIDENDKDSHIKLDFDKDPLGYGVQRFVDLEKNDFHHLMPNHSTFNWGHFSILVSYETVLHKGMVFTELDTSIICP